MANSIIANIILMSTKLAERDIPPDQQMKGKDIHFPSPVARCTLIIA